MPGFTPSPEMAGVLRFPRSIVFLGSFCLMVIELTAGRIMAPYLGVSLYTWTSIIGVMLAGITVGNYFGGKIADRKSSRKLLGFFFIISGIASFLMVALSPLVGNAFLQSPLALPLTAFLFSLAVFFLPSVFLSLITPMVIKLILQDLRDTGRIVGQVYATSALGSIVGTFATGYYLIAWFGTRSIIISISIILLAAGIIISAGAFKPYKNFFLLVGILFFFKSFLGSGPCFRESRYFCIQINFIFEKGQLKSAILKLDDLNQSYISAGNIQELGYEYEKVFAVIFEYLSGMKKNSQILFLGGGGYVLPRYIEASHPETKIEVVEIDQKVTEVNFSKLWLNPKTKIITHTRDAREFVQSEKNGQYDMIVGDVFNDFSIPYHLTTEEFNQRIKKRLKSGGIYAVNIVDDYRNGEFLFSFIHTMRRTFPYVYLAPQDTRWQEYQGRYSSIVFGSDAEISPVRWSKALDSLVRSEVLREQEKENIGYILDNKQLGVLLGKRLLTVLTDDYAPIDNMLAPVFKYKHTSALPTPLFY